jgi:hypothetical protein
MNIDKKVMSMGIVLLIAGMIAAAISFEPSGILLYAFMLTSLTVGVIGVLIGKDTKEIFSRSKFYAWSGFTVIGLSIALATWASGLMGFITATGLFLVLSGFIAAAFTLQILNYESPIPWKLVGLKLTLSAMAAIAGIWILMIAGFSVHVALLAFGVLFVLIGISFIQISRITRNVSASVTR